ncbi:MAG: Mov34/MPN/PAD-1 family protein [Candidatus Micrarchaeota archaeon]|nr:Mov34/MPN/PAD-1 family protein [Candidatus Micrarchaeota archaeon]
MEPIFFHDDIPVFNALDDNFSVTNLPNLAYLIDGTGWKVYKRNCLSTATVPIKLKKASNVTELCEFTASRISLELVNQIVAFFREVYKRYGSEAAGYIYYHPAEKRWQFIVPKQTVSGASCKYELHPLSHLPNPWRLAGTIHSHANMAAFHSSTDCDDEHNFDGVHITVGRLGESQPEFACSIVAGGTRFKAEPSLILEGWPEATVPDEWLRQVTEAKREVVWEDYGSMEPQKKKTPKTKSDFRFLNKPFRVLVDASDDEIRRYGRWS